MNYTKGDWSVRSGFKVTSGEEQTWVADCYPYHPKHPRPRIFEAMANAHLIAASPRMYEALGTIKRTAQSSGDNVDYLKNALRVIARISEEAIADMDG